jgi:hypothetical protein
MVCPASAKLSEGLPDKSSKYADEGSLAHEVAACILRGEGTRESILAGLHSFEYGAPDEKMLDHVDGYVAAMRDIIALDPDVYFEVEQRVQATDHVWGTADFWAWLPNYMLIVSRDLKYGAGEFVEVVQSKQQKAYLLGVINKLAGLYSWQERDLENSMFEMGVYQPRNLGHEGQAHRTSQVTWAELRNFRDDLDRLHVRVQAGTEFKSGKCRRCKAVFRCPLENEAMEILDLASPVAATNVQETTNEQLSYWLQQEPRFRRFLSEVKREAVGRLSTGQIIEGFELSTGMSNRAWTNEAEATRALTGLLPDAVLFEPRRLKTPAQVEKHSGTVKSVVARLTERHPTDTVLKAISTGE